MIESPVRFSILINNYNYGHYLGQAIESCVNQTYKNFEIIVIDDGSTDHSMDVCKRYSNSIAVIHQQANGGQGSTFNVGLTFCRGQYICLLDSDDVFLPDKLAVLDQKIAACAQPPIFVHHQMFRVNQSLIALDDKPFPRIAEPQILARRPKKYWQIAVAPTSALTFKKSFLDQIFPLCPFKNRLFADCTLKSIGCVVGPVLGINAPLSLYRLHSHNNFTNIEQMTGNRNELIKNMSDMELSYDDINDKLRNLGITITLHPSDNALYLALQTILGHRSKYTFIAKILFHPLVSTFTEKKNIIKWVLNCHRKNGSQVKQGSRIRI